MKNFKLLKRLFISFGVLSLGFFLVRGSGAAPISGADGASLKLTNRYVPLEGDATLPNGDVVTFSGQVHVLSRVTFSEAFVPAVQIYVNLIGVEGRSDTTGHSYLLVGASNLELAGINPGPPDIPEQKFNFSLVDVSPGPPETPPSPIVPPSPIIPVYLNDFTFAQEAGSEGLLISVNASFVSD